MARYLASFNVPLTDTDSAAQARQVVLADTTALMVAVYSEQYFSDTTLWPQALAMFAWGSVVLTLATLRSSKRLG